MRQAVSFNLRSGERDAKSAPFDNADAFQLAHTGAAITCSAKKAG